MEPFLWKYFKPELRGLERIQPGAGLYVANHNAGLLSPDSFIFGTALYRKFGLEAVPFGLTHEYALALPLIRDVLVPLGAVRASHENAARLFASQHKVIVYPGGDLDALRPYRHRKRIIFGERRGYIRLALREKVPLIPVVSSGAHETFFVLDDGRWLARALGADRWLRIKVWPLVLSIPWGLTLGPPPPHFPLPRRIEIDVLEPVHFERYGEEAASDRDFVEECHERVHSAMERVLQRTAVGSKKGKSSPP